MTFGSILIILIYRFLSSTLFHDLSNAVIKFPGPDLTYIILHLTGLPESIVAHLWLGYSLDVSLFLLCLILTMFPSKAFPAILFSLLFLLYIIVFNTYTNHHYHSLAGVLFISIPFWFRDKSFDLTMRGIRYYLLFVMFSAALWKLFRGAIFNPEHFVNILKSQHLRLLLEENNFTLSFLIQNESISYILFIAAFLCQLSFGIGFFTRKLDILLLIIFVLFMILNLSIMKVFSFELLILAIPLLYGQSAHQSYSRPAVPVSGD